MGTVDMGKRSRRGPVSLPADALRQHCVSVRLNAAELALLDESRGRFQRGEWMRMATFGKLPPSIAEINLKAWTALATVISNLNQFQSAINRGNAHAIPSGVLEGLCEQVQSLRRDLIGANVGEVADEGHE
ncbi:hypothetical protein [Acidithiobacillus sp.]